MGFFSRRTSSVSSLSASQFGSIDAASSKTYVERSFKTRVNAKSLNLGPSLDSPGPLNSRRVTISEYERTLSSDPDLAPAGNDLDGESEAEPTKSKIARPFADHRYPSAANNAISEAVVAIRLAQGDEGGSTGTSKFGGRGSEAVNIDTARARGISKGATCTTRSKSDGLGNTSCQSSGSDGREGGGVATAGRKDLKHTKPLNDLTYEDVQISEEDLRSDINEVWKAMHLFMNSSMIEAEDICLSAADHRLYFSVGYTLIQCIKSLMTFEPKDLEAAVRCCQDSLVITGLLRKKDYSISDRLGSLAKGTMGVGSIRNMTVVQRHAELVHAECLLLKAVIGIIYSGDFISFLKEALNMRSAYAIYRTLAKFVDETDTKVNGDRENKFIDNDFRSGVFLGTGLISLILSLLPSTVLKFMEVFGFTGDREYGLRALMSAGKWSFGTGVRKPAMKASEEGLRRQVCDMALLFYHLVISTYLPVTGVDIGIADKILHYNLKRYPDGVFFLYFSGRLYSTQTLGDRAVRQFHLAIQAQREYIQLQHICHWDLALTFLSMGQYHKAYECFDILDNESNWSKAVYAYGKAVTLYETNANDPKAAQIMRTVPDLMQRIAGKSIPLEKFVARKSHKFIEQGNRLLCPGVELAYVLNCLSMAPRSALFEEHLNQVSLEIAEIHKCKDHRQWHNNEDMFWDDYCLAHLLRGIILRFLAHPDPHTRIRHTKCSITIKESNEQAMVSFNNVFKHGRDIRNDHHIVYFAHFELGRLYSDIGKWTEAEEQFNMVMTGKGLEISTRKGKGKVSLQNQAVLRTHAALGLLRERQEQSLSPDHRQSGLSDN